MEPGSKQAKRTLESTHPSYIRSLNPRMVDPQEYTEGESLETVFGTLTSADFSTVQMCSSAAHVARQRLMC